MNLATDKIMNQRALDWEGAVTAELYKPTEVCRGQVEQEEQKEGVGGKGLKRASCV